MAPLRDKLFVISLIVLTALAIAAVPRINAAAPAAADSSPATASSDAAAPEANSWSRRPANNP